jgi:6-phospho-beta-glucosidase
MSSPQGRKFVVIGGGSSYTPEIMEGLIARAEDLAIAEVWLVDIPSGSEKLNIVGGLAGRMVEKAGRPFDLKLTLDRREALPGADFVVTQMRVGGIPARIKDEHIPLRHGVIGQETTGPGGFAKALRTIPAILAICRDLEELSRMAWIINFTNPSGLVTEAITRHSKVNVVGLCNLPIGTERWFQRHFKVSPEEIFIQFAGLNHLVWVTQVLVRGVDRTQELIAHMADHGDWPRELLESLGAIPCGYHRYYYLKDEQLEHLQQAHAEGKPTRGEAILGIEKELFAQYASPDLKEKPAALSQRGGGGYADAALRLVSSICHDRRDIQCVDTPNRGALSDLPLHSVVETNCVITSQGPVPLAVGPLPPQLRGLLQQVKAYEELTVAAAVTGDRKLALQALIANPLVPSARVAKLLLDDLLAAHAPHLPQFAAPS